jgi:hypothetical protein
MAVVAWRVPVIVTKDMTGLIATHHCAKTNVKMEGPVLVQISVDVLMAMKACFVRPPCALYRVLTMGIVLDLECVNALSSGVDLCVRMQYVEA